MLKTVKLTKLELEICDMFAVARDVYTQSLGLPDNVIGNRMTHEDQVEVYRQGFIGELAFAKIYNQYPNLGVGIDLADTTKDGKTIDVKCIFDPTHNLIVNEEKETHQVDVYALVQFIGDEATLIGYQTAAYVFDRVKHFKEGLPQPGFLINRKKLRKFK